MCNHLTGESYRAVPSRGTVLVWFVCRTRWLKSVEETTVCEKASKLLFLHVVLFIMPYKAVYDFLKFVDEILLSM